MATDTERHVIPPPKRTLSDIWDALNPSEPSPTYLVKLMAFALTVFAVGLAIGQLAIG